MIKAICFDLDGVYFTPRGKNQFHENLIDLGIPEDKVVHVLYKSPEMFSFVKGEILEDEFWDFVRNYFQINMTNEEWIALWIKGYEIDQKVRNMVKIIRDNGYRTCICSNNNVSRVQGLHKKFGFLHDFDVKVFSYDVGDVKPSQRIFQALIDKSGVQPAEIVYSDDREDRIEGAGQLGINVFVYEDFHQFLGKLRDLGVRAI